MSDVEYDRVEYLNVGMNERQRKRHKQYAIPFIFRECSIRVSMKSNIHVFQA